MGARNYKVVTAEEMARIEKLAIESGCSEESFIYAVGKKIGDIVLQRPEKRVTLLVGKGNNGADAYAVGIYLLQHGIEVRALALSQEGRTENERFRKIFLSKKGKIELVSKGPVYFDDLILDGLLGVGFKGEIEGEMASLVDLANRSGRPILAIDIPSGLNATTGALSSSCICASETVTLGLPKIGLFLRDGWSVVGNLRVENFGLPEELIDRAKPQAYLLNEKTLFLPKVVRNRHKYQAGYVVGISGSDLFKGAPKLAALAALRAGAGMVRVFHLGDIGPSPMELICEPWNEKKWENEIKRASALFMGPGWGAQLPPIDLQTVKIPSVIDADLLQPGQNFPKQAILTPHRGEMLRLLGLKQAPEEEEFLSLCQKFAAEKKIILILKGAPTFIFKGGLDPLIVARGDPGMATAGAGDVLTGVLAALLAQKMDCYSASCLGVYLHALAGEIAAKEKSSYSTIASDLISRLFGAFQHLICLNQSTKREIPTSIETEG